MPPTIWIDLVLTSLKQLKFVGYSEATDTHYGPFDSLEDAEQAIAAFEPNAFTAPTWQASQGIEPEPFDFRSDTNCPFRAEFINICYQEETRI